jgi:hypothetical protein
VRDPVETFEASTFRPVEDGFVFRTPNPWLFGRARHYRASEAQKNEIIALVRRARKRSLPLVLLLWGVVVAALVAAATLLTGHYQSSVDEAIDVTVFAISFLFLFLHVWYVMLLRPSIRSLTPTDERYTYAERRAAVRAAMAGKSAQGRFLLIAVVLSLSCCFLLYSYLLSSHGGRSFDKGSSFASLFAAVASAVLAGLAFYREIQNSRFEGRAVEEKTAQSSADLPVGRLERLQSDYNEFRRNATLAATFVAAAAVGAVVLNGTLRTVDADSLIVRNANGGIAAMLFVREDGGPMFVLHGPDHQGRMSFALSDSGAPSVALYGPDGNVRAELGLYPDGMPILQLTGSDEKSGVVLTARDSDPGIVFSDATGAMKLKLAVDSAGVPIRIFNASPTPIKIFDADGKELPAAK